MLRKIIRAKKLSGIAAHGRALFGRLHWLASGNGKVVEGTPDKGHTRTDARMGAGTEGVPRTSMAAALQGLPKDISNSTAPRLDEEFHERKGLAARLYPCVWSDLDEGCTQRSQASQVSVTDKNNGKAIGQHAEMQEKASFNKDARFDELLYNPKHLKERVYQRTWREFQDQDEIELNEDNEEDNLAPNKCDTLIPIKASGPQQYSYITRRNKSDRILKSYEQEQNKRRFLLNCKSNAQNQQIKRLDEVLYKPTPLEDRDYQFTWREFEESKKMSTVFQQTQNGNCHSDSNATLKEPAFDRPISARSPFNNGMGKLKTKQNYMAAHEMQVKFLSDVMAESRIYKD